MNDTREALLDELASGPVSGSDLADRLGVTRAAVWKHVEALREAGFRIDAGTEGYALIEVPEFGGEAVTVGLDARFEIEYHETIASTNDRARELATAGDTDVVVLADEQTGGRGRLDRSWASPSGGVYLSILCRPNIPPAAASRFTLAAAVATARAARAVGVEANIKWPNDVTVGGRKLAGILTEMEGEADRIAWLVVGVGVNANVDTGALPGDREATSLAAERGDPIDRRRFTQRSLETFDDLRNDPDGIVPAWRDLATTIGRDVRVETPAGRVEGRAVAVTDAGALLLETADGRQTVTAGDCEHLRTTQP